MVKARICVVAVVVAGLFSVVVGAQGRSGGRGQGNQGEATGASVSVVFRAGDQAIFGDYFRTHRIVAEPLPPGIAKNVARGKPLPPGIAKRGVPADLVALGPKVDKDVSFAIVGEVVVAMRSGVVIDVLAGVFK
jgi:hypothetical protein